MTIVSYDIKMLKGAFPSFLYIHNKHSYFIRYGFQSILIICLNYLIQFVV